MASIKFETIKDRVESAIASTAKWSEKQYKFHRLRMRMKKEKTFPFKNSSNLRMPTAETKIRKRKAAIIQALVGIRPIIQAMPTPGASIDKSREIEKFMDHLMMDVIGIRNKLHIILDQTEEKGMYLAKPYWDLEIIDREETLEIDDISMDEAIEFFDSEKSEQELVDAIIEKVEADMSELVEDHNRQEIENALEKILSGEDEVEIKLKDVIKNNPDVAMVSPERFYVPSDSGFDVDKTENNTHEFYLPLRVVKENINTKGWSKKGVSKIESYKSSDVRKLTDISKDLREGIETLQNQSNLVKIWEHRCWVGNRKMVITTAPDFSVVLRESSITSKTASWGFVKFMTELIDDRWFAHRGLVEIAEDIIKEIDIQHMQKIDQQTVRNVPQYLYRAGLVNPNLLQFRLDQAIPVNGMQPLSDSVSLLNSNNPNVDFSYEKEEQILLGRLEELTGQVDFNIQSQINRREPRTASEVRLQASSAASVFSMDLSLHIDSFSKLIREVHALWSELGPEEYEFQYFGEKKQETIKLTREEIQGYFLKVRGNDINTDPNIRATTADFILKTSTNPTLLQLGIVGPQQISEALRFAYQELNVQDLDRFVALNPQAPQGTPEIPKGFDKLAAGEQAQILQRLGIQPDIQSRALDKEQELLNGRNSRS